MKYIIGYVIFQVVLLLVLFVVTNKTDKRSKSKLIHSNQVPAGFEKTSESYIDSRTKKKIYVYYNSSTGKRIYVEEEKL